MQSHPLVCDIEFIRLRRGTNATSIEVASNSCRKPTVTKGQGIGYVLIGEFCQKFALVITLSRIFRACKWELIRVLFIDMVKFQSGWYHGLNLKYQARPGIWSGRAFFVDQCIGLGPI